MPMKNIDKIKYVYLHRQAIKRICKKLGISFFEKHDIDKMQNLMTMDAEEVKRLHLSTAKHHDTSTTDERVLMEMIVDWESARYTKPDKPLNAYDTLYKHYPEMEERILPLLKKYGLDYHTPVGDGITDEEFEVAMNDISEDEIIEEIKRYA